MKTQNVLPFKIEAAEEKLTAHSGLAVFGEFLQALGLSHLLEKHLPKPKSAIGYSPTEFCLPLLLTLHGGGASLEDIRMISRDSAIRELLSFPEIPSSDAYGDWLFRTGSNRKACRGLKKVNNQLVRRQLNRESHSGYTLDIDASQIVAEKKSSKMTYKGELGYMPIVGHLAENGLIAGHEFREGNVSPGTRNLEFAKECIESMPKNKPVTAFRADSASYQASVFNYLEKEKILFAIGGDVDVSVKTAIKERSEEDWRPYDGGHITEIVHCMNHTKKAFRLIIVRRPFQQTLSGEEGEEITNRRYRVTASNRKETAEETLAWYNQRGHTSENHIKYLKNGFHMERMPCGTFEANSMFFGLGVLAYNLHVLFKAMAMPVEWKSFQIETIRWRFYQVAGRVVHHARNLILKVSSWALDMFEGVRHRCRELAAG